MRETGQYRNALAPHLWRDGAAQRRHYKTHRPLKGKRLTTFCASLALLHPLLSLTHWIFRSLMLPYKSSSHSAKCVRCAPQGDTTTLGPKGRRPLLHNPPPRAALTCAVRRAPFSKTAAKRPPQPSGQGPVKPKNLWARRAHQS